MNTNSTVVIGVAIAAIVLGIGFFWMRVAGLPGAQATSTPPVVVIDEVVDQPTGAVASKPTVKTSDVVAPTDTTAVVSGSVTPNSAPTTYHYEYGTTQALGDRSMSQNIGSGRVNFLAPAYLTGLTKDTGYYFRLVAENAAGITNGVTYQFRTSQNIPAPLGSAPTPKTLPANGIARTSANLNGEVLSNKATTRVWFEYGETPEFGKSTPQQTIPDGTGSLPASLSISNLKPATTHYFRINAQNQFGTVNGAILNFKTAGPAAAVAPTVITSSVTEVGTSSARLKGTVNPHGTDTSFWFEFSTDPLFPVGVLGTTSKVPVGTSTGAVPVNALAPGLSPLTTYYYRLVAESVGGINRGKSASLITKAL